MERWKDRVAVVTGASSGIGHEVARRLLDAGMRVHAWARREERMADLVEAGGGRLVARRVDLRSEPDILAGFAAVRDADGGVDVMVNNAGLGFEEPLTTGDTERWREMLEVNVLALCVCTREAVADMRRRGDDGHVVHVSSMAGHRVPPGSGVYSATKYAVRSLTEGLRRELRELSSGVRVTAISPGFVETGFHGNYYGDEERAREAYSRFKVLDAADVAAAVTYVLGQPPHVQVHDVLIRPTDQTS
jgi:NADP-dependent 3-hydroxy acid dehydrogenase YdfG